MADVVRAFLGPLRERHALTPHQDLVLGRITHCQTAAMGGHVMRCTDCGVEVPMYNSCRDRHCPNCGWGKQLAWMEERKERILPCAYFHTVFTLPEELRSLVRANASRLYGLLFDAVATTLKTLSTDPGRLGAMPGFTLLLHTWDRHLRYHPHLHGVITAGGLAPDGTWKSTDRPGRRSFLFPVKVMAKLFRGVFMRRLFALLAAGAIEVPDAIAQDILVRLRAAARKSWIVYAKRPFRGAEQVYEYLGRYTHRVGISNSRMIAIDGEKVRFHTKDGRQACVEGVEFVRRLAEHVLPAGFTRIRHYGLLSAAHVHAAWQSAYQQLAPTRPTTPAEAPAAAGAESADETAPLRWHHPICPRCSSPTLVHGTHEEPTRRDTS